MIAFLDFETRSLADLPEVGAYAYARHPSTDVLVLTFAFDDEPVSVWSPEWAFGPPDAYTLDQLMRLYDFIEFDGGLTVAWNMHFDRHIWNQILAVDYGAPPLPIRQTLCAMAQAEANNLPGKLAKACEALRLPLKDEAGARMIGKMTSGTRDSWSEELRAQMGRFRAYGARDTAVMRNVWRTTRPLTAPEWAEYHASEVINDRGVAVDQEFAQAATRYAAAETVDLNAELADVTEDRDVTVTHHLRKAAWLHSQLWPAPELQALCVRKPTKRSKQQGVTRLTADRSTREIVRAALAGTEYCHLFEPAHLVRVQRFIEIIEAGNGAAVNKFKAIARTCFDGRVHGQYSFNGGGQTGRFSSRGVQIHNLIREPLDKHDRNRSIDCMEDILNGASAASLEDVYGLSMSRLLARLLRPTLIAPEGRTLVWGDWDQIEARVLPWLSNSNGGEAKLDVFRRGDDVYRTTAAGILNKAVEDISDEERQIFGKVPELALGFGGSIGAFAAMGRHYGVVLPETQARSIVDGWRRVNGWAGTFWEALWTAAMTAWREPGKWCEAGRVKYLYHADLMHGTLICVLPDGRWLVYPQLQRDEYEHVDPKTGEIEKRKHMTFVKGYGSGSARVPMWAGTLTENITQATAASILRRAIVRLQGVAVLHTHDEIGIECDARDEASMRACIKAVMEDLPDWAAGLPLTVSVESGPFYSK